MNVIDKSRLFLACLAIAEQESHEVPPISKAVFQGLKDDAARDWYDEGPRPFGIVGGEVMEFGEQRGVTQMPF